MNPTFSLIDRRRARRYTRRLTAAGSGIHFGGPHITLESGPAMVGRGISLGDDCTIYDYCILVTDDYTDRCGIEIGSNSHINYSCYLCGTGGLTIGSNCLVGPGVKMIAANHRFEDLDRVILLQGHDFAEIVIHDNAWM